MFDNSINYGNEFFSFIADTNGIEKGELKVIDIQYNHEVRKLEKAYYISYGYLDR